ncbi:hypothetical protein H2198_002351 [Neophaeococcomyces mojaviensis]|uniref:Uncharacterized protein n=1 Tax=Neophaeococcomyces mojaviensis TaxID=3383035 RepID=A0ACC3AEG9_9EURO|nr:hypothetical protein H2198_002351 [Knufia sp. JES_112]
MADPNRKITLYRGFPNSNSYVWSPFVTKLEFRFRYSKLPYHIQEGSTREGPNGKIPYIGVATPNLQLSTNEEQTNFIADSTVITSNLVGKSYLEDLNGGLTAEQKAADMGLRALCEDKLYFFNVRVPFSSVSHLWPPAGTDSGSDVGTMARELLRPP